MQNSVDGQKAVSAESAMNEELVKLAEKEGDQLHRELAHRIRVLTTNLTQCEAREHDLVQNELYLAREIQDLGRHVAEQTVGSEDRRPNMPDHKICQECGKRHSALVRCQAPARCGECGGRHEPSGARSDCIRHWKLRAIEAENACLVNKIYGVPATIAAHENEKLTDAGGRERPN